jgi:citrate lyase subunit beta/citryl-CoA lyase
MRSLLFVPGHNRKFLDSALKSGADVLLPDIEDSVQPLSNKQVARDTVLSYVQAGSFDHKVVFPRINGYDTGELLHDVMQLTVKGIAGFMYPKAKEGSDIAFIDRLLETVEIQKGMPVGTFKIIPLIETASAVLHAEAIAKASKRVVAIAFGCEDYITDLGGIHDGDEESLFVPRATIAMAARASGVHAIDTVHIDIYNLESLEKNLVIAKKLGFKGMLSLHPIELPLIHQYFSPSAEEVAHAKRIIELCDMAVAQGKGVAYMEGKLIGPPMIKDARNILAIHHAINNQS